MPKDNTELAKMWEQLIPHLVKPLHNCGYIQYGDTFIKFELGSKSYSISIKEIKSFGNNKSILK